jgi:ribokinase
MTGRVIVVGSVNVDLVVNVPFLPHPGETVTGGRFDRHHGGKGGNQAVAAARLGAPTWFVGAVGDDAFGREARTALSDDGVDVSELVTNAREPTGVALIVVGADGESLIAVASGANAIVRPEDVRAALERLAPGPGDVVLTGNETPTACARLALRLAREAGARTILNPAPAEGIDRSTFGLADVLTPNARELTQLARAEAQRTGRTTTSGTDPTRAARSLIERNAEGEGADAVLVSLGVRGAVLVGGDGSEVDLAAPGITAVDAVGAGDTLNGALAVGLAEGLDLADAARRAVMAASMSTIRPGARGGMPLRRELEEALAQRG